MTTRILAALLAALTLLAGCASGVAELPPEDFTARVVPTPTPEPVQPAELDDTTGMLGDAAGSTIGETAFVLTLDGAGIEYGTEQDGVNLGNSICESLDEGATDQAVIADLTVDGYDVMDAAYILGAAEGAICPRHL